MAVFTVVTQLSCPRSTEEGELCRGRWACWGSSMQMHHLRWASGIRWDSTPGGSQGWLALGGRGVQIPSQEKQTKLVNTGRVSLGPTMSLPVCLLHSNLPLGIALFGAFKS